MRFSIYLSFLKQTRYYIKWFLESVAFSWHWVTKQQLNFLPGFPGMRGSKYFLRRSSFLCGQIFFGVDLCVGQNFLRESKVFWVSQLLFTWRDYLTILLLMVSAVFSWIVSQHILTKLCLTYLVFLRWSSLWHYLPVRQCHIKLCLQFWDRIFTYECY